MPLRGVTTWRYVHTWLLCTYTFKSIFSHVYLDLFFFFLFWGRISCVLVWLQTCCIAKAGFELLILPIVGIITMQQHTQFVRHWRSKPGLCMLDKHSANWVLTASPIHMILLLWPPSSSQGREMNFFRALYLPVAFKPPSMHKPVTERDHGSSRV